MNEHGASHDVEAPCAGRRCARIEADGDHVPCGRAYARTFFADAGGANHATASAVARIVVYVHAGAEACGERAALERSASASCRRLAAGSAATVFGLLTG